MKKAKTKSTRSEHKRLVLHRDTMRTLSGGYAGDNGDNTACTGNETGCIGNTAGPCDAPDR